MKNALIAIGMIAAGRKQAILMDNNFLAAEPDFILDQLAKIARTGIRIDFNQGLDARLLTARYAKAMSACKWIRFIRFSCDSPEMMPHIKRAVRLLKEAGCRRPDAGQGGICGETGQERRILRKRKEVTTMDEKDNRPSGWTVFEVPGDSGLYVGTDDATICRVNSGSDDDEPDGICRVTAEAVAEIPEMIAELESWRDMCLAENGKCPGYPNCRTCEIIDKLTMFRKAVLHA